MDTRGKLQEASRPCADRLVMLLISYILYTSCTSLFSAIWNISPELDSKPQSSGILSGPSILPFPIGEDSVAPENRFTLL